MRAYISKLSTWEMEAGKPELQSYPQLHSELKASLGYMRSCLKEEKRKEERLPRGRMATPTVFLNIVAEDIKCPEFPMCPCALSIPLCHSVCFSSPSP